MKMNVQITAANRRAFSLIELLVAIAIIALLVSILLPALAGGRRAARQAVCMSSMRQFGVAYQTYANENRNFIASLSGDSIDGGEGKCAVQALQIIGSNDNRGPSSGARLPQFPVLPSYGTSRMYIFEQYSYLPLLEYMGSKLRTAVFACPEDRARLSWQKDPLAMANSPFKPLKTANSDAASVLHWWPYSSSYQVMPANISKDTLLHNEHGGIYSQGETHDTYLVQKIHRGSSYPNAPLFGRRKMEQVGFPAQKVLMGDTQQRHDGKRDIFFAYEQASQPLLFWDGAVANKKTRDANPGWHPSAPEAPLGVTLMEYAPDLGFESPVPDSQNKQRVQGYYRWTRDGLRGIDFGGRETHEYK